MKKGILISIMILLILTPIFFTLQRQALFKKENVSLEDRIDCLEKDNTEYQSQNITLMKELSALEVRYDYIENEYKQVTDQIAILSQENHDLKWQYSAMNDKLAQLQAKNRLEDLSDYWQEFWRSIYGRDGELKGIQIAAVNELFQPTYYFNDRTYVSPISCFFTSLYDDISEINLTDFLRYFPSGEILYINDLDEFKSLQRLENWPFESTEFDKMPVPIHRYHRETVEKVFYDFSGISLDDLTGVGFNEVLYLKSTECFYNYTSDFGPGCFACTSGEIKDGDILLYGENYSSGVLVLKIIEENGGFVIKSLTQKEE